MTFVLHSIYLFCTASTVKNIISAGYHYVNVEGGIQLNKIKGYRTMLSLTQKEMGEKLGISKQAYWNKENGLNSFTDKEKIIFKKLLIPHFPEIKIDDIFFQPLKMDGLISRIKEVQE